MRRLGMLLLLLLLLGPDTAMGQTPSPDVGRFWMGAAAGPGLGNHLWLMPSLRASMGLTPKLELDIDAGRVFGSQGSYDWMGGAQLKFLRAPASAVGSNRYWLLGPLIVHNDHSSTPLNNVRFGYGWEERTQAGARLAIELGMAGGEGPVPYVIVVCQFGPRRR